MYPFPFESLQELLGGRCFYYYRLVLVQELTFFRCDLDYAFSLFSPSPHLSMYFSHTLSPFSFCIIEYNITAPIAFFLFTLRSHFRLLDGFVLSSASFP